MQVELRLSVWSYACTIVSIVMELDRLTPVLFVLPDADWTTRLREAFDRTTFHVECVDSIDAAEEMAGRIAPAVAFVAISLNESEDGVEAARAIQSRGPVPIVFIARGPISPALGMRMAMVPHDAVLPVGIDPSYVRETARIIVERGGEPLSDGEDTGHLREQMIENVLRLSPTAVIVLDEEHRVVDWNPSATQMFGYTRAETIGRSVDDLLVGDHDTERRREAEAYTHRILSAGVVSPTETVRYRKDGTPIDVILAGTPIHVGGRFRGAAGYYHDNTEQKRARRRVEELLEEKEILLGEIHHRVKNDIALIESMLNLQASRYRSEESRRVLKDAINRIASVRSVYDALHRFRGVRSVGSRALIKNLTANHKEAFAERSISLTTSIEEITLPTGTAVSLGLVVNELLTNVAKYAFPPGRDFGDRSISITLERREGRRVSIIVRDNGVGLPAEILDQNATEGYGLTFVRAISEQYNGQTNVFNESGACIEIGIDLPKDQDGDEGGPR